MAKLRRTTARRQRSHEEAGGVGERRRVAKPLRRQKGEADIGRLSIKN